MPQGLSHLAAYRWAFERRYGRDREIPLLDLLDANFGLGPPATYGGVSYTPVGINQVNSPQRIQALMDLCATALREGKIEVVLENDMLKQLQTTSLSPIKAPTSLDLYVSVGAASRAALDDGQFEVVIGPNVAPRQLAAAWDDLVTFWAIQPRRRFCVPPRGRKRLRRASFAQSFPISRVSSGQQTSAFVLTFVSMKSL